MSERIDQFFVHSKAGILDAAPEEWRGFLSLVLSIMPLFCVFPLLFALTTVLERKALGRIQNRFGPNRVGPWGLLQPVADGIKMLIKEDIVPRGAERFLHFVAPILVVVPAFLALAVLPYGRNMTVLELETGLLFFFAVGSATELAVFMAGWASRNKYSVLGAMRAVAQLISYELPLVLSVVPVVMIAGTLSLTGIVASQGGNLGWYLFTPWGFAGFILFLVAAAAEANRTPFDLPEGESEIVAGYFLEYSGFKFALFFLGEYLGLFAASGLAVTLFLGGWQAPFSFLGWVPSYLWFFGKLFLLIAGFIWVRGTLPRLRMDQLMSFAWKFMLPLCLINIVVAVGWQYGQAWQVPGGTILIWILCAGILLLGYYGLARGLSKAGAYGRRSYLLVE